MRLWLWCRLAATALIRPLAWEPPYAAGVAQEIATTKDKKTKDQKKREYGETETGLEDGAEEVEGFNF